MNDCSTHFVDNILKKLLLFFLLSVKWFLKFLSNMNNSLYNFFAHSEVFTIIAI